MTGEGAPEEARDPERTLVLLPELRGQDEGAPSRPPEARRAEAVGLAEAIGLHVAEALAIPVRKPVPATLFGAGKVEELKLAIRTLQAGLVIVDHPISPIQQRNLERAWNVKILDRTGLILEIFGERAHTKEGTLQVELAHLNYQRSRLVRSWTHLERQRGGFGFLGGPGETQIEADRRLIQDRIRRIEKALESVRNTRNVHRAKRQKVPHPVAALVGYTNAGKSTLFNHLTGASVMAQDQLFATLDPTMRRVALPHGETLILSDTVGFISDLPTSLVEAFRATLEEVIDADLIVHVRDIASPETQAEAQDVAGVLAELGIEASDPRLVEVWNKVDLLEPAAADALRRKAAAAHNTVAVSALTGEGLAELLALLEARLFEGRAVVEVMFEAARSGEAAWLYENGEVLARHDDPETGVSSLTVRLPSGRLEQLRERARGEGIRLSVSR
ncbi:GTPase HflX [Afifella pfennigii]|uniref:GTPase HflX n=1 Tax=Afifella pfennigii TaxID=209897 RepID=UPI00068A81AD